MLSDQWMRNFEGLKVLQIIRQDFYNNFNFTPNTNLEELEIYGTPLNQTPLIIPTVKKLKVCNLKSLSWLENEKFITLDNKVEELEVIGCRDHTEGILMDVANKMKNLRVLKVRLGKASEEVKNMVRMRCTKLEECIINVDDR
jgi:hypothetical protein